MNYRGLTDEEVLRSRAEHGRNVLTPPARESLWKRFFEKLTGPFGHLIRGWQDGDSLIFILEIAALLSVGISCAEYYGWYGLENEAGWGVFFEPLGILIAILLATGVAFVFELKADREFSLLNQVDDEEPVQVIRNGRAHAVPKQDIVVGDIVLLSTGQEIPADAELLESTDLIVDESSLTGEPMCRKGGAHDLASNSSPKGEGDVKEEEEPTFPDHHVMRGTKVLEGHGVCRVFAVGDHTENGRVMEAAQIDDSIRTPLNEQLDRLGKVITQISYTVAALIVLGRVVAFLVSKDWDFAALPTIGFVAYLLQTVMIAVTLIVVAVPEGLPMAVSLSLAYSMRRMLKTQNLVRKMHACETMGAATVICTDKTGTLTQNQMTVRMVSADNDLIREGMAVNATAMLEEKADGRVAVLGNPTEGALLMWLREQGVDYRQLRQQVKVVEEVPFSTERKYMATLVDTQHGGQQCRVLHVKGAPEIVVAMCGNDGETISDDVRELLQTCQRQAMRTLAFACQEVDESEQVVSDGRVTATRLHFLGIVAINDPVRSDVPAAVAECLQAGIDVKIVTGDTALTACEVGRQTGIWTDSDGEQSIITGTELSALSDEALKDRAKELKIIARARPMDKKRLVEALQQTGEVVAVTGDGTNDAPALKTAHVGLSMGDGTAVAKEASDITILDNSFSSIGRAVMWGRSLHRNIQRFILFQTTVNVAASLIVLCGAFMSTESPLTVTQMLWVNLIMDTFAAMALASLPPSPQVMKERPRDRRAFIISRGAWRQILVTGLLFFAVLLGLLYVLERDDVVSMTDLAESLFGGRWLSTEGIRSLQAAGDQPLTPIELSLFFTIFVMMQFWNLFNARAFATGESAFHLRGCKGFLFIAMVILVGQIVIVSVGKEFFNVVPLPWEDWAIIIAMTSLVLWIGEAVRMIVDWRYLRKHSAAHERDGKPSRTVAHAE